MRLKNIKGASQIIEKGNYYIDNPKQYKGSWKKVFKNDNPIYLEIGMGKGDFLIQNALELPNINFIGIEKYDSVIVRAIQKSNDLELNNLKLIKIDAIEVEELFEKEIDKIYLNFSDPWPKERHAKRRLTSPIFLNKYDKILKENKGYIEMKTDNIDLFQFSLESLKNHGYEITYITNDLHQESGWNIMTEYEKKFAAQNIKINKLVAKK